MAERRRRPGGKKQPLLGAAEVAVIERLIKQRVGSPAELARRLHRSGSSVGYWLKRSQGIRPEDFEQLASALGTTVAAIREEAAATVRLQDQATDLPPELLDQLVARTLDELFLRTAAMRRAIAELLAVVPEAAGPTALPLLTTMATVRPALRYGAFRVNSDSMAPEFRLGQWVVVDTESDARAGESVVALPSDGGEPLIHRYHPRDHEIELRPLRGQPRTFSRAELAAIWPVVDCCRPGD